MSRFIDRTATVRYVLPGGCQCPGTPHTEDWIDFRSEIGIADIVAASQTNGDALAGLERVISDWNLLLPSGDAAPVSRATIGDLFGENFEEMGAWIAEHIKARPTIPNGFGAHSVNGTRASASRVRGTTR
ncbi:MAG: hypothetical protein ACO3HN_06335 [Opitutales bacterium]